MSAVSGSGVWEGRVEVTPGLRLRARLEGPAGAPIVLPVNGVMMAIEAWQGMAEQLLGGFRLLRYDMRGQGGSDQPAGPHTIEAHAADLLALLQALPRALPPGQLAADDDAAPLHLVGLSSGVPVAVLAAEAMRAAGRPPTSLALLDGYLRMDAHLDAVLRAWIAAHELGGPGLRFDVATPWVWGAAFLQEQAPLLAAMRQASAAGDPERVHALLSGVAAFRGDVGPSLARLRGLPLLALWGEDDRMTPPHLLRGFRPHAPWLVSTVVEGAGHASPIERPEAVADALRRFWQTPAATAVQGGGSA